VGVATTRSLLVPPPRSARAGPRDCSPGYSPGSARARPGCGEGCHGKPTLFGNIKEIIPNEFMVPPVRTSVCSAAGCVMSRSRSHGRDQLRVGAVRGVPQLPPGADAELGEHVAQVPLDGPRAEEEPGADFGIGPGNTVTNWQYRPQVCPDPAATRSFQLNDEVLVARFWRTAKPSPEQDTCHVLCHPDLRYLQALTCCASSSMAVPLLRPAGKSEA